jgi:hypothetical protein
MDTSSGNGGNNSDGGSAMAPVAPVVAATSSKGARLSKGCRISLTKGKLMAITTPAQQMSLATNASGGSLNIADVSVVSATILYGKYTGEKQGTNLMMLMDGLAEAIAVQRNKVKIVRAGEEEPHLSLRNQERIRIGEEASLTPTPPII